jgi:integrase
MYLSKRYNGYYYIFYPQLNGKKTCISTKTKIKNEALKFLSRFEKEIETRTIQKMKSILLSDYIRFFLSYSVTVHTKKTKNGYLLSLNYLQNFFGNINLSEITPPKMSDYFEKRINESSIYQARKDLICFNSMFNKAIAEGYILQNPCKDIKRFRLPQKQPLFFSELEFELLMSKVKESDLKDLFLFAIQTGLRQMELLTLEWSQINFKDKFLILDNREHITKSKNVRTIPLSIKALQILIERERVKKGNIVFTWKGKPINQNFISKKFKSYVMEANINSKLNFHALRHSFASWLVQKGVSIYHVSKLLGHANVETTEIYSHLRAEDLRNAISVLNN